MSEKIEGCLEAPLGALLSSIREASEDPYIRDALAKVAVREMCWQLVDKENCGVTAHELADHLELMAGLLRDSQ
jgi:hypothetical protein